MAIVVDAGAGNAHTIMPLISLDLNRLAGSCHVVSKPLPPAGMPRTVNGAGQGLDLVEALFRLHWVNPLMADLVVEPLLRRGPGRRLQRARTARRASSIRRANRSSGPGSPRRTTRRGHGTSWRRGHSDRHLRAPRRGGTTSTCRRRRAMREFPLASLRCKMAITPPPPPM